MHTEWGIAPTVIRAAKRHGIGADPPGSLTVVRDGRAPRAAHRMLATAYRGAYNTYLRFGTGLAKTDYFGDAIDTAHILQTTWADVEVMDFYPILERVQPTD